MKKLGPIAALAVSLMVVLPVIAVLVYDREARMEEAQQAIANSWAPEQQISGPYLVIPHSENLSAPSELSRGGKGDRRHYEVVVPSRLEVETKMEPQRRRRGIFTSVVYTARIEMQGTFTVSLAENYGIGGDPLNWQGAHLVVGLSDVRGLVRDPELLWQGQALTPVSGVNGAAFLGSGVQAQIPRGSVVMLQVPYRIRLDLRGTGSIFFDPTARSTQVSVASPWPNPSFVGASLPASYEISDTGFQAKWEASHWSGGIPMVWTSKSLEEKEVQRSLKQSRFGVHLLDSNGPYRSILRSLKYGVLFIGFTFLAFFLFEIGAQLRIHLVQYVAVGSALCTFYLLLLSLSEQIGFKGGYLLAAMSTVALVSLYSRSILCSSAKTWALTGLLGFLYSSMFFLLQLEDYALLVGSMAVFAALASFMVLTRKVDWYALDSSGDS